MNDMARRAFLGMSHSPLFGLNPLPGETGQRLSGAIRDTRQLVQAFDPELIILIGPDHYNGFFNELMPPFCLGTRASSVGDYLTPSGPLNVPEEQALSLGRHLMDSGFDVAISRRMQVDHGFAQALQFMWDGIDTPPVIPLFMNAVAKPGIPRLTRCRQLGASIGRWLDTLPQRILVIGSGGLSHEPPVPTLEHPDEAVRERITVKRTPTRDEADAKTRRVMAAGMALAAGDSGMKPLAPEWDRQWLDAIEQCNLGALEALSEDSIEHDAGLSAHESKTWLIARAATAEAATTGIRHYQAIPELIAGYGVLFMH
ncbi:3-carboxyethylcatechol 2,3-dioxygenase [Parapusillimonas granuli]|uniref:3-carboxyethylcatechol 2,3-dioxygenase n=2 Tax=Parapusillimonas granuli TaxID=380911 RepID=A0A853G6U4_9BURK|nr:3-carboxyethylcatechol 2,3-dioxygenase [Parapusillimonas granuli]MBB5213925.1 2,3-dihydroxyphenylpropionate 1,2-dioxygenase [Parapusillimonas granuli]NYT50346.1 3-carboxyethylcatechol 2,3-dioxygenase [Parapusillimonas granuli]